MCSYAEITKWNNGLPLRESGAGQQNSGAVFTASFEEDFANFSPERFGFLGIVELDMHVGQTRDLSTIVADKVRMLAVGVLVGASKFKAPDAVAQIEAGQQADFDQVGEVAKDRGLVESQRNELGYEFGVCQGGVCVHHATQDGDARVCAAESGISDHGAQIIEGGCSG